MHMSEYLHKSSIGPVEPKDFVKDYGEEGFLLENGKKRKPYGSTFPTITIGDMVRAQKELADGLGIKEFLKRWIDIVDFDAVEVDGGEGLAQAVVGFPIVTIGC